ncbi:ChaN family lipoprotein [Litoribacter alkaliphilus]|uniref:ChaN family lipoprotein n=1 Tax=Litoribacter ruber TaxID=702568 RepID=A0AAP2CHP1_9BACT|nr:ChaN family lipoprotein [Litoribacter alkaliphilus]MBS9522765.1 ChaN family lipoprotein [Litoribacter alkaliphilus]
MNKILPLLFLLVFPFQIYAQTVPYRIFNLQGEEVSFEQMAEEAAEKQVVLFGELHNNSIAHWLQLQLLKSLHERGEGLVFGGEFFEADDQLSLDEWFGDLINEKNLEAEVKLWNNYQTDYKPLVQYAKSNDIPFVATNVPRKYASAVSRGGLEVLEDFSEEAKLFIAPLPIEIDRELPGYVGMKEMMHGSHMNAEHMVAAQALKDATMAYFILKGLDGMEQFYHINGSYHSNNYEGIVWYLKHYEEGLSIMTITVEEKGVMDIDEETRAKANFIIVLPTDSPKSY